MTNAAPSRTEAEPHRKSARGLRERWRRLRESQTLARINHVLIPQTKAERDRWRRSASGRAWGLVGSWFGAYSREGRSLLLVSVLVGCSSLDARFTQVHELFAMLVAVLAVSLVARPWFRVTGLEAKVLSPARVTVGLPSHFEVVLTHRGSAPLASLRIEEPFLPWDGQWVRRAVGVDHLAPGERKTVVAAATFSARGEHHLDGFDIGALVPLGLALGGTKATDGPRFLVVPRVAQVVSLSVQHRLPERRGQVAAAQRPGDGEIAGVRPYRAGDPLKHLHARTWARTGVPHVRHYAEQRHDRVALVVLVDGDDATERTKEATLSLAAGIAARLALHEGGVDSLQLDAEVFPVDPRAGARALDRVLDRLGVHEFAVTERDGADVLLRSLHAMSSLVLVTAGFEPRHAELRTRVARSGVPCRWVAVREPLVSRPAPEPIAVVEREAIEAGRPVVL
jgi:uncharacterized protein (DUF58 family)